MNFIVDFKISIIKYKIVETINNTFIVYKIIACTFIYANKLTIYKNIIYIKIYVKFLTYNITNNKLKN